MYSFSAEALVELEVDAVVMDRPPLVTVISDLAADRTVPTTTSRSSIEQVWFSQARDGA